jgi:hypothetical protein
MPTDEYSKYQSISRPARIARQTRGLRHALAGACLVIVLQWAIIAWLVWFRRPC